MRIIPLGCYGSDLGPKKSLSIAFSPSIILDAGAILGTLPLEDILKIKHIIISHAHFDHIKELPMLADLLLIHAHQTITIHCTKTVGEQLRHYIFNNIIWPDFTQIPKSKPTILFDYFSFETPFVIDDLSFLPFEVNHVVESSAFIISDATSCMAWSGDTHRSASLIEHINKLPSIDAIFFETSFPNRLQAIADASLHLTPQLLYEELHKIRHIVPTYIFHLKPNIEDELKKEILSYDWNRPIHFLEQSKSLTIG